MMTHTITLANNFERAITRPARTLVEQVPRTTFSAVSALLFIVCAVVTVLWCNSMSEMGGMPMPGGWTMSMAWMRMPGQTWAAATAPFIGMWMVMMAAMMLPSLAPVLSRYRRSIARVDGIFPGRLTAFVGLGYFFTWAIFGLAIFPLGAAMAAFEMERPALARAVPFAAGLVVLLAGALQFTRWKAHHLASCREAPGRDGTLSPHAAAAWKLGLHVGVHCGLSCANLTAVLLVAGVMDLRAMAAVTAAITAERLAPAGKQPARAIGSIVVAAGFVMIVRAAGIL